MSEDVHGGGGGVLGALNVRLVVLVCHVDPEALVNVQEVVVDVGQRLVILLEGL